MIISPSLPAHSFEELQLLLEKLSGVIPMFQVDIVDGQYVPHTSWPFTEQAPVSESLMCMKALTVHAPIEVDCMVQNPEQYLDVFVAAQVSSVIVHVGSTNAFDTISAHAKQHGYTLGVAITNDVPLTTLTPLITHSNFVQVMGIAAVGAQGQPFDTRTLETLKTLRREYPLLPLVVDGAVNADTAVSLKNAGATRLAPGSYIAKATDPLAAYKQLCVLVGA